MINPSDTARSAAREAVASQNQRPLGCIPFFRSDCTKVTPAVFQAVRTSNNVRLIPLAQARAIVNSLRNAGFVTTAGHLSSLAGVDAAITSVRMGKSDFGLSSVQMEYAKAVAVQLCSTQYESKRKQGLVGHVEKTSSKLRDLTQETNKVEQLQGGCWGAF